MGQSTPAKDLEFVVMALTFFRFVFLRKALNKLSVHAVLKLPVKAGCDAPANTGVAGELREGNPGSRGRNYFWR